ncbi:MAG: alpha-amylase family glycosyl hydrolase [Bacteroidota bacterium]
MRLKRFFYALFFSLLTVGFASLSCKKENPVVTPDPPPVTTENPVQYETPFLGIPQTADVVMYEINERAFSAAGTFAGILPHLDSIKSLGVNVIWLMPINPIGAVKSVNSPYCVKNYVEVNPEYGNLENLRTLVREAHKRNMAVILDWAANHTSWDNPWVQAHKDWYTQDAAGNIIYPEGTNWQDVADLNYNNAAMRLEMIKALKYWVLTANVDGYRCDAADYVPYSFWKQAIDSLKLVPNRKLVMLAEGARKDHFDAGFQMNFGWDLFNKNVDVFKNSQPASGLNTTHQSEYSGLPNGVQKLRFTSNHDKDAWEDTPLGFFGGKDGSMAAFVMAAYMGGVPLIYNGQEVGCPVKLPFFSRSPINWATNPDMMLAYQKLMNIRSSHSALRSGSLEYYADADIAAFKRKYLNDEVLVIVNTRNVAKTYQVSGAIQNTSWTDALTGTALTLGNQLSMNAFEYRVLVK